MRDAASTLPDYLPLGAVTRHFGVPVWRVRRLFERGLLPPAARVGPFRVVRPADLPTIEAALLRAGYRPDSRLRPDHPSTPGMGTTQENTDGLAS